MSIPQSASSDILDRLAGVLDSRKPENGGDSAVSYVAQLFQKGDDAILKKIGEEATEVVMAAKDARAAGLSAPFTDKVISELADLWFHSVVLLKHFGLSPAQVMAELARREGLSGLTEKERRQS